MSRRIRIALDAMGGDKAPDMVLKGANIARERHPEVEFILYGREEQCAPILAALPKLAAVTKIIHAEEIVSNDMKPSIAMRTLKKSSMRLSIDAVSKQEADCIVSAGNTGALMATAKFVLGTIQGVDRPAIASFFPTEHGECVMLDLGANLECDADNLVQFAVLGEVFARTALGMVKPRVGLLNVGSEEQKGHEEIREAAAQLRAAQLPIEFSGFIEGNDIAAGVADVVVTDGFTGNVALKTAEGTAKMVASFIKEAIQSSFMAKIGYIFSRAAFQKLRARMDPRRYNGAVLLGLDGVVVKSHGGTDAIGFAAAIGVAVEMVKHGFLSTVRSEFEILSKHLKKTPESAELAAVQ
ncbi:MAG: phosphate acyltransferase PlsX [Dongiaceae bacterium]